MINAATLFSGIGAPELAMPDWRWLWGAEIDPVAGFIYGTRHKSVPNLGDVNAPKFIQRARLLGVPDVLVFGSPCQSFSCAGSRNGLDDKNGQLLIRAIQILEKIRPAWFVLENVPELAAHKTAFKTILQAFDAGGYHVGWRLLCAESFGLPLRRKRLFLVGHHRDWRGPAAVLFEPASYQEDHEPRDEQIEEGIAAFDLRGRKGGAQLEGPHGTVNLRASSGGSSKSYLIVDERLRRMLPVEAERAMGFPDGFTDVGVSESSRFHAIGNSMAIPVIQWILSRIEAFDANS